MGLLWPAQQQTHDHEAHEQALGRQRATTASGQPKEPSSTTGPALDVTQDRGDSRREHLQQARAGSRRRRPPPGARGPGVPPPMIPGRGYRSVTRIAQAASSVRLVSWSFVRMFLTCPSTVRSDSTSRPAMARLVSPPETSAAISRSRGDRVDCGRSGPVPRGGEIVRAGTFGRHASGQLAPGVITADRAQYPAPQPQWRRAPVIDAAAPQHAVPVLACPGGQFLGQPRLADPRRPGDQRQGAVARQGRRAPAEQLGYFVFPPRQLPRARGIASHRTTIPWPTDHVHREGRWRTR